MKCLKLTPVLLLLVSVSYAQIGIFEGQTDVGNPKRKGIASYNSITQQYKIEGSGENIWYKRDEFKFVWRKVKGDFLAFTLAEFIGKGVDPHRKIGWMVRTSLDDNSPHALAVVHGDGLTSLQFRKTVGGETEQIEAKMKGGNALQLERVGNVVNMWVAKKGDVFQKYSIADLNLGEEVYVGLFVCSHNADVSETALFDNVRLSTPARPDLVQYREYLGSNIEIYDMATDKSSLIFQSPKSLQAPNWTHDGKSLIYNSQGLLYKYDLKTNTPTVLSTGSATRNNNDHVISFDGKMLGISSHIPEENNNSVVYTVPITGGEPKRITGKGHSYFHGWSVDGKWLTYTAQRNNQWDIYKIPSNGGEEVRLTESEGKLDDGSEFSPDGKYIYFNSDRTGLMQLWRMKTDGSEEEQITNDEYNNWFPHPSPDGKWIVYLSFLKDEVKPNEHPFYKHVYLRIMPYNGGPSKVVAYIYGGQGTINTPSWSPDSKKFAFVSNTNLLYDLYPRGN